MGWHYNLGGKGKEYRILLGKTIGRWIHGRKRNRWEDNIKMS
jgi:hypothetical protein